MNATKKKIHSDIVQVLFERGLTSKDNAHVVSLQVQLLQALGSDIKIINSSVAGEIIGLVGEEKDVTIVLQHCDIVWKKN